MWEGRLEDVSSESLRTYKQDGTLSLLINSAHLTSTPCHPDSHAFVTNMPMARRLRTIASYPPNCQIPIVFMSLSIEILMISVYRI